MCSITAPPSWSEWPVPVRADLARRAASICDQTKAGALDLADPSARAMVYELGASGSGAGHADAHRGPRYDVVLSVAAMVEFADLPRAIRGIRGLLAAGGELWFVEPVLHPGWRGVLRASAGARIPAVARQHLGRDVPLALRAGGLTITTIERFTMPTLLWPLRPFVQGRAKHFSTGVPS